MKRKSVMLKNKYVSWTIYQKLVEENKRLIEDIRVMACGECFDAIQMRLKWRKIFKEREQLEKGIKEMIKMMNQQN